MLDLETVYKALYDVARVQPGERVFVEGAAGGTGIYAVACAALRGALVTGLVSTEAKGRLVLSRGGHAYVNRTAPELPSVFTAVPPEHRWHIFSRFYRLRLETIERFYAMELRATDMARILAGRPPTGFSLRSALNAMEAT